MKFKNPYAMQARDQRRSGPAEATSAATLALTVSPTVENALARVLSLSAKHRSKIRRLDRGMTSLDVSLAAVCTLSVETIRLLTPAERGELVSTAMERGLIKRRDADPARVLARIACGPDASMSVLARVAALTRHVVEKNLNLADVFDAATGFWAAYERHIPPRDKDKRRGVEPYRLRVLRIAITAGTAERLIQTGSAFVTLTRDPATGAVSEVATEQAAAEVLVASDRPDDSRDGGAFSPMSVPPSTGDGLVVDEHRPTAAGSNVTICFGKFVRGNEAAFATLKEIGRFHKIVVDGRERSVWTGPLTPTVKELATSFEGRLIQPTRDRT